MKNLMRISMALIVFLLFFQYSISAFALDDHTVPILEAIELPPDLNFTVNNTCSGHAFFMQATANELGYFAVYSPHVDPDDLSDVDLKKVYIDIYQPDGSLLQELSFTTSLALTVELEENRVNIIFSESVLVYDFITQELLHLAIPVGTAENSHIQKRSERFTAGEWEYNCKKGFLGYVQLSRNNGEQEQVLIDMSGINSLLRQVVIPGCFSGALIILLIVYCRRKRKQNH